MKNTVRYVKKGPNIYKDARRSRTPYRVRVIVDGEVRDQSCATYREARKLREKWLKDQRRVRGLRGLTALA